MGILFFRRTAKIAESGLRRAPAGPESAKVGPKSCAVHRNRLRFPVKRMHEELAVTDESEGIGALCCFAEAYARKIAEVDRCTPRLCLEVK